MSQNLRAAQKTFRTTRCWEKIYAQKHLEAQYVLHISRFLTIYPRISILHFYQCRYTNHTYQFSTNVVFSMTSFDRSPGHNHPRVGYNHPGICRFCIHETMVLYVGLYVDMFKICTSNHDNMKPIENPWLHHFKEIRFFFSPFFYRFSIAKRIGQRPTAPDLLGQAYPEGWSHQVSRRGRGETACCDIFCGARNLCSLLKDWFCQFSFGGDCFYVSLRGISQNGRAFIHLSVFFSAMFQTQSRGLIKKAS